VISWLLIVLGAVLANNFVLAKFLGLCPFFGASRRMETALGMSLATTFVLTISAGVAAFVEAEILRPQGLESLRLIALILVIASLVQVIEHVLRGASPLLFQLLGIYLPLITTNCAVLAVAILQVTEGRGVMASALQGFGTGAGFAFVLLAFTALRERIEDSRVPPLLRGAPIALVTAGMMALAFMGFTGSAVL